jgi:hypothetical protein
MSFDGTIFSGLTYADFQNVLAGFNGALFPFWFLFLIASLGWKRGPSTVVVWFAFFALWGTAKWLAPIPIVAFLIPEPYNTVLFFVVGAVLIFVKLFVKWD